MTNITYTERNGIRYPNLKLPEQTIYPLGKYAILSLDFMKKHRRGAYTTLFTEGRLNEYLHAIDIQAHELLDNIIPRLANERWHRRSSESSQRSPMDCGDEQHQSKHRRVSCM